MEINLKVIDDIQEIIMQLVWSLLSFFALISLQRSPTNSTNSRRAYKNPISIHHLVNLKTYPTTHQTTERWIYIYIAIAAIYQLNCIINSDFLF